MAKEWRAVPPNRYYYSMRAEMFSASAAQALAEGRVTDHSTLILKAIEYRNLAEQLPLEEGINEQPIQAG